MYVHLHEDAVACYLHAAWQLTSKFLTLLKIHFQSKKELKPILIRYIFI